MNFLKFAAATAVLVSCCSGCATTKTTNTARTATEQLLLSNAIDQSLNKVDFTAMYGRRVFLDPTYLDGVDKQYVIASLRHHLLYNGVHLASAADKAEVILEPRSGGIGTDTTESYYGIPGIALPGGLINLPEVKFVTRLNQHATAKIGLAAYDVETNSLAGGGGVSIAQATHNNWNVLGVGPFKSGTMNKELKAATAHDIYDPTADLPRRVAFSSGQPGHFEEFARDRPASSPPELPGQSEAEIRQTGHSDR
ncbi:MAG: hypothetical protein O3B86_02345 [Planctomycetota bacterium]|nr:hypothetical protein [Planctomycetota bacterium]